MANRLFKRKIYDKMLQWKQDQHGTTALLIRGARRIGKSTIAEQFAKQEQTITKSQILLRVCDFYLLAG